MSVNYKRFFFFTVTRDLKAVAQGEIRMIKTLCMLSKLIYWTSQVSGFKIIYSFASISPNLFHYNHYHFHVTCIHSIIIIKLNSLSFLSIHFQQLLSPSIIITSYNRHLTSSTIINRQSLVFSPFLTHLSWQHSRYSGLIPIPSLSRPSHKSHINTNHNT